MFSPEKKTRRAKGKGVGDAEAARAACIAYYTNTIQIEALSQQIREAGCNAIQLKWLRNWVPRAGGPLGARCDDIREILDTIREESA